MTLVSKHQTFQWIDSIKEKVLVPGIHICFHITIDGIIKSWLIKIDAGFFFVYPSMCSTNYDHTLWQSEGNLP